MPSGGRDERRPTQAPEVRIRWVAGSDECLRLVEIWRSAVDPTYDFLASVHRDEIRSHLESDFLPKVDLYVAENDGVVAGFARVAKGKLEMLFFDNA